MVSGNAGAVHRRRVPRFLKEPSQIREIQLIALHILALS